MDALRHILGRVLDKGYGIGGSMGNEDGVTSVGGRFGNIGGAVGIDHGVPFLSGNVHNRTGNTGFEINPNIAQENANPAPQSPNVQTGRPYQARPGNPLDDFIRILQQR